MKLLERLTLSQSIDSFLQAKRAENISHRTYECYSGNLRRLLEFTNDINLLEVSPYHIRAFQTHINETRKSTETHHQYYRVMRTFFKWCVSEGFLSESPMTNIKAPRRSSPIIAIYTPEDIERMLALCKPRTFLGARDQALILFMLDTGCRVGELEGIVADDVDVRSGLVNVTGKGRKSRTVGLGNKAKQALMRYLMVREIKAPSGEEHLWLSEEMRPLSSSGIKQVMKRIKKRGKLTGKRYSCHTFRHTFAVTLLRSGCNIRDLQTLGGWESLEALKPYIRMLSKEEALKAHRTHSPADSMLSK